MMNSTPQTLAQRITAGRIPVAEGLQIAMSLAEQMRQWHDAGSAHGGLSPSAILLQGGGVQLLPPPGAQDAFLYHAPEVRQGAAADVRSDIYSFGAIVFEMLTAHRVSDQQLPVGSGHAGIDRLVNGCVAASPDSRYQRMPK